VVEIVTDYLDGALSPEDRQRFEQHIAACDGCTAYVDQLRDTRRLLGSLGPDDVSPEAARELGDVFRDWRASRS
jgi:anti-sigma factor RsiW